MDMIGVFERTTNEENKEAVDASEWIMRCGARQFTPSQGNFISRQSQETCENLLLGDMLFLLRVEERLSCGFDAAHVSLYFDWKSRADSVPYLSFSIGRRATPPTPPSIVLFSMMFTLYNICVGYLLL
jgi:hypothetical protein